jgi:Integrase core domain
VRVPSPCKRAGVSSIPPIGLMPQRWCGRSTSSSTLSSTAWRSKIASMIDEHTRESLLNLVERSITAERLVTELAAVVAAVGGPPTVLRLDHGPPGCPWDNGYLESFNNRLRKECLDRNHWTTLFEARGGHRRRQTRAQPPTPAFGPGRPNACRVGYGKQAYPHPGGLRNQLNPKHNNPTLIPGGLSNRDSPITPVNSSGVGPGGGVVEVDAAGAVEGFFRGCRQGICWAGRCFRRCRGWRDGSRSPS